MCEIVTEIKTLKSNQSAHTSCLPMQTHLTQSYSDSDCVWQEIKLSGSEEGAGPGHGGDGGTSLHSANLQGEVRFIGFCIYYSSEGYLKTA